MIVEQNPAHRGTMIDEPFPKGAKNEKKENLGFLTVGLVVGLLIGSIYSQQSAVAANVQGRGKLVNAFGAGGGPFMFRMWEDGTVEMRKVPVVTKGVEGIGWVRTSGNCPRPCTRTVVVATADVRSSLTRFNILAKPVNGCCSDCSKACLSTCW